MAYPDLKAYTLGEAPDQKIVKVVGWLSKTESFPKGDVPTPVIDRLWEFCKHPMGHGFRQNPCQLCPADASSVTTYNDEELAFDKWLTLLICNDEAAYLAPHVIFHYIVAHRYLPPQEFLNVVLEMPLPSDQQAYFGALDQYYGHLAAIERLYVDIAQSFPSDSG